MLIKKFFSLLFCVITLIVFAGNVLADPLLLTDAEMKKLARYFPNEQDESMHFAWNGDPIAIQLPLNQERRIIFSAPVIPDLKSALTTDQLHILNDNKSLYLTALKPFTTTRLFVTVPSTGEVMLIDLSTSDDANNTTIYIDGKNKKSTPGISASTAESDESLIGSDTNSTASDNDTYVTLIRFAWQQLYSPQRLIMNSSGISRAPMHTDPMLSTLVYGDKVYANPEVSWVYNNTYVTAVELRNKYSHETTIHLNRDLCGDWQAASIYPRGYLKPAGNKHEDSAILFLVSKKPFGNSMEICNGDA